MSFKNALVSVADKTNIVEFIKPLAEQGMRILSTGGTARTLREAGIEVLSVSDQTKFPEVMDGRVKTLHPNIHMCLLARGEHEGDLQVLSEAGLEPIDLVVGNLYRFEDALSRGVSGQELTEFIDIGGPSFLRAGAKNFSRIAVVCDPSDYKWILEKKELDAADRQKLASKVFAHTSSYDSMIASELGMGLESSDFSLGGAFHGPLRYGENPQQRASWFRGLGAKNGLHSAEVLQGKDLSFNNILDIEAAVGTLREFSDIPCCVALKHQNPCGVSLGADVFSAVDGALTADPVSVFGGIIAVNAELDVAAAKSLSELFLECIVAPKFSEEAKSILSKKKNLRLLEWPGLMSLSEDYDIRPVTGGFLLQSKDQTELGWGEDWKVIGTEVDEQTACDLIVAWKTCAHLKSNAIAIVVDGQTVGLGMGQVNRVDAVEQAIERMRKFHPDCGPAVMASDAFFPFADSIEALAKAGIQWVIQPGGSIKDDEVIAKAKELGVHLVLTGKRHFLH